MNDKCSTELLKCLIRLYVEYLTEAQDIVAEIITAYGIPYTEQAETDITMLLEEWSSVSYTADKIIEYAENHQVKRNGNL